MNWKRIREILGRIDDSWWPEIVGVIIALLIAVLFVAIHLGWLRR